MSLHAVAENFDSSGRLRSTDLGTVASVVEGLGYTSSGRLCTTTLTNATDSFVAGIRVSAAGRLVISTGSPVAAVGGLQFDGNGALIAQTDAAVLATDSFVAAIRASGTLGVQVTVL